MGRRPGTDHQFWVASKPIAVLGSLLFVGFIFSAAALTNAPDLPSVPGGIVAALEAAPEVLVGAGDISTCSTEKDEATAQLLDGIAGTVVTLGDNVYPDGTTTQFTDCYQPTWGRHKARTRPSPGNHEYHTPDAAGYFEYFAASRRDRRPRLVQL